MKSLYVLNKKHVTFHRNVDNFTHMRAMFTQMHRNIERIHSHLLQWQITLNTLCCYMSNLRYYFISKFIVALPNCPRDVYIFHEKYENMFLTSSNLKNNSSRISVGIRQNCAKLKAFCLCPLNFWHQCVYVLWNK